MLYPTELADRNGTEAPAQSRYFIVQYTVYNYDIFPHLEKAICSLRGLKMARMLYGGEREGDDQIWYIKVALSFETRRKLECSDLAFYYTDGTEALPSSIESVTRMDQGDDIQAYNGKVTKQIIKPKTKVT